MYSIVRVVTPATILRVFLCFLFLIKGSSIYRYNNKNIISYNNIRKYSGIIRSHRSPYSSTVIRIRILYTSCFDGGHPVQRDIWIPTAFCCCFLRNRSSLRTFRSVVRVCGLVFALIVCYSFDRSRFFCVSFRNYYNNSRINFEYCPYIIIKF